MPKNTPLPNKKFVELYLRHRPKTIEDIIGQPQAVSMLKSMVENNEIPHAILLTGPSGTGKTTIARILRKHLNCHPQEFHEVNIADIRGIDNVRDIRKRMNLRPLNGKTKVWLLDEAAKLSRDAQEAMLKMLEDTPSHVYFMLATTDPQKLLKTIRTRCTEIALKPIGKKDLTELVKAVWTKEAKGKHFHFDDVVPKIVENSDGSARKALVLLGSIIRLESEEEMLEAIEKSTQEAQAINLCRLLLNPRSRWAEIAKLLKELDAEDAEGLRHMTLRYMRSVLFGGGNLANRAANIMGIFERNFYDSGHDGLALACWEAMGGK
jgi:DNA polymerase III gamma/tau subunit